MQSRKKSGSEKGELLQGEGGESNPPLTHTHTLPKPLLVEIDKKAAVTEAWH